MDLGFGLTLFVSAQWNLSPKKPKKKKKNKIKDKIKKKKKKKFENL